MSPAVRYTLDSDSFIGPYRKYYSFERAPGFWDGLESSIEHDSIVLVDRVFRELTKPDDPLSNWLKRIDQLKIIDSRDQNVITKLGEILDYIQSNELIDRIEVNHVEEIDGKRVQKITIYYHFIGNINIPDTIPDVQINMNTRKGVSISCASADKAVQEKMPLQ